MPWAVVLVAIVWFWQLRRLIQVENAWRAAREAAGVEVPPPRSAGSIPVVGLASAWKKERLAGEATGVTEVDDLARRYRQLRKRLILIAIFGLFPALVVGSLLDGLFGPYLRGIAGDQVLFPNGILVVVAIGGIAVLRKIHSVYEAVIVLALGVWFIAILATEPIR
jgi:hypothetical protein